MKILQKKFLGGHFSVLGVITISVLLGITSVVNYSCDDNNRNSEASLFMVGTAEPAVDGSPLVQDQIQFSEILAKGTTGIATVGAGEGEAIGIDGDWWTVDSNGDVSQLDLNDTTIFGAVADFIPDNPGLEVSNVECTSTLETTIDSFIEDSYPEFSEDLNWFLILVEAHIATVEWVDFNPNIAPEEEAESLVGTIIGLRTPTYADSFGQAPYHWHFVSDNRKLVGHIESCSITVGSVITQRIRTLNQIIPDISDE